MMKTLALALSVAAFTGSAIAADLPARPYTKAPPPPVAPVASWTGCDVGGGGGDGMWDQENTLFTSVAPRTQITDTFTAGGRGYFGTVQGGCDYQFGGMGRQFLVGAFGDYDFSSFRGKLDPPGIGIVGDEKMSSAWSVGGRVGWVVVPRFLTYFSAGYTEATFDRINFTVIGGPPFGVAAGLFQDRRTYRGVALLPDVALCGNCRYNGWRKEARCGDAHIETAASVSPPRRRDSISPGRSPGGHQRDKCGDEPVRRSGVRRQPLTAQQQILFATSIGPLDIGLKRVFKRPERLEDERLIDISNVALDGTVQEPNFAKNLSNFANQLWHSDSSFMNRAGPIRCCTRW